MAEASDYLEGKIADHITGKTTFTLPSVWVALATAAISDTTTGSTITEAAYTSYARKSTTGADWNAATAGVADNANAITFVTATGGSETETDFCLVDAATLGNILVFSTLDTSRAVSSGVTPEFAAGDLTVTVT